MSDPFAFLCAYLPASCEQANRQSAKTTKSIKNNLRPTRKGLCFPGGHTDVLAEDFSSLRRFVVCCFLAAFASVSASAQPAVPSITKVEPPSWWAGHTINPVRLLVRGKNLTGARVRATKPGTQTSDVVVNRAGTYLFVNVTINPRSRPASYPLTLVTAQGSTTIPFELEAPLAVSTQFQGIASADVIYLIMPDRFADGDPSNNLPAGAPAAASDRKNPRGYHGGDLRGVIDHLPYLKDLGVTALWLKPSRLLIQSRPLLP